MKSFSKWYLMFVTGMFLYASCNNIINTKREPFLTSEQRTLIRTFATQNGYAETVPLDSFVEYLYKEWPYDNVINDFLLTFPIQDTVPRILVLTDVLTQIGKGLRVFYSDRRTGDLHPAYIDSIEIRTDSVIVLPSLDLEYCNLTHLPATIGNVRTKAMNIRDNPTIQYLPNELMRLTEPPEYYDTFVIKYDKRKIDKMDPSLVSDTLKNWLNTHAAPL